MREYCTEYIGNGNNKSRDDQAQQSGRPKASSGDIAKICRHNTEYARSGDTTAVSCCVGPPHSRWMSSSGLGIVSFVIVPLEGVTTIFLSVGK